MKINLPKIKFSHSQFNKLADIASNLGFVALTSLAIPIWQNTNNANKLIIAVLLSFLCWAISLLLIKT